MATTIQLPRGRTGILHTTKIGGTRAYILGTKNIDGGIDTWSLTKEQYDALKRRPTQQEGNFGQYGGSGEPFNRYWPFTGRRPIKARFRNG